VISLARSPSSPGNATFEEVLSSRSARWSSFLLPFHILFFFHETCRGSLSRIERYLFRLETKFDFPSLVAFHFSSRSIILMVFFLPYFKPYSPHLSYVSRLSMPVYEVGFPRYSDPTSKAFLVLSHVVFLPLPSVNSFSKLFLRAAFFSHFTRVLLSSPTLRLPHSLLHPRF